MGLCSARAVRVVPSSWLRAALIAWALCLALASPVLAQTPLPTGPEFQVNTYTTDYQGSPSVAAQANGDFVVVWESYGSAGDDSSYAGILGQRYDSSGSTVGPQFQVNTYTTNGQNYPSVATDADGAFVVVWESYGSAGDDLSYDSIQGQRYDSSGSAAGGEFQVNTYTTDSQDDPSVAIGGDGAFVVVWESYGSAGDDSSYAGIQGQRYDSSGSTAGAQFQVNTYTTSYQDNPSIAIDPDGDFVVVWESDGSVGSDSSYESVQGQRYNSSGALVGAQFQVNTYTTDDQDYPSVAVDPNGGFVVV